MVRKCWHYKYNDTTNPLCLGTFEECATKVDCKPDDIGCFALARLDASGSSNRNNNDSTSSSGANGTIVKRDANSTITSTSTSTNKTIILSGGCLPMENHWHVDSCYKSCLGSEKRGGNYYCCCTDDGCNNMLIPRATPISTNVTLPHIPASNSLQSEGSPSYTLPVIVIGLMAVCTTIIMATYFRRTRLKRNNSGLSESNHRNGDANHRQELHDLRIPFRNSFGDDTNQHFHYGQHESQHHLNHHHHHHGNIGRPNGVVPSNNHIEIDLKRIKLLDIVGSGRFGTVHKATLTEKETPIAEDTDTPTQPAIGDSPEPGHKTSEIAVKIIPNSELQSWQNELRIFSFPRTRHPNILTFLGCSETPDTKWLLVEYASNGSLHHYLKSHTVTWLEFLNISLGIARGLSHLHDADIAHRDFKSKNVLLRHNLSPCITDFGVAALLDVGYCGSQHEQRKYLQLGTPRYMAPEVLECLVVFTKISFTKIDVYALSLVLWELLSRCYPLPRPRTINEYDDKMLDMSFSARSHEDRRNSLLGPNVSFYPESEAGDEARVGLLNKKSQSPPNATTRIDVSADGDDVIDGSANPSVPSTNGFEASIDLSDIVAPNQPPVPDYRLPYEEMVGSNPDINTMRQAVVTDKLRPPIKPEWRAEPLSRMCEAIVHGWDSDQDTRTSASCFVERIEALLEQQHVSSSQARESSPNVVRNQSVLEASSQV